MTFSRRKFLASAAGIPLLLCLPGRVFAAVSVHQMVGEVHVNGKLATNATVIKAGDKVTVADNGKLVMSIGEDAFLLRGGSMLETEAGDNAVVTGLRLAAGAMLAVFGKRQVPAYITSPVATIGIRGTAVYLSLQPHRMYGCTCYGDTDVQIEGSSDVEQISATHHHPYEIAPNDENLMAMREMPVKDHTDDELRMLEALVGRKPAFDM
ncbi:MAG: hypothetical protein K8Q92_03130 [Methylophilales bacterium]|nr:hypothetical protein [Methylophilales bacterium]